MYTTQTYVKYFSCYMIITIILKHSGMEWQLEIVPDIQSSDEMPGVSKFSSPGVHIIGPGAQQFLVDAVRKNQFKYCQQLGILYQPCGNIEDLYRSIVN